MLEFHYAGVLPKQAGEVSVIGATRNDWLVIKGKVLDDLTHKPVEGALVRVTRRNSREQKMLGSAISSPDGTYVISIHRIEVCQDDDIIINVERKCRQQSG